MIGFRLAHGGSGRAGLSPRRGLLAVGLGLAVVSAAVAQEPDSSVREEITVFEAQMTVDASSLSVLDRQRLKPEGILLLEGGLPRRVTNLETVGQGSWRILIYVDAPTSRARTIKLAAQRLGSLADELTGLGSVAVVVADPEPRVVIEATREATPLAERLAEVASSGAGSDRIKVLRDAFTALEPNLAPTDPRRAEALAQEVTLVREQVDRLILRAAQG